MKKIKTLFFGTALIVSLIASVATSQAQQLTKDNLPLFLQLASKAIKPGTRLNNFTVIENMQASGVTLTTNYILHSAAQKFEPSKFKGPRVEQAKQLEARVMCSTPNLQPALNIGAVFKRIYRNKSRQVLYQITVNKSVCAKIK